MREEGNPSALVHAIRITGIAPIALLVGFLALHNLLPGNIRHWFQPIVDKEVAVLTLSAGHAGIIGLLISTKGRFTSSTYALFIAAVATALAGLRTIGESTTGVVVALMLFLLTIPAVWAEALSARVQRVWGFLRSREGILSILFVTSVVGITYYQSQYENYIRDFILIPFGILAGITAVALMLWLLFGLSHKYVPTLFAWLLSRIAAAYTRIARRRGKSGDWTDVS
ncbi:MAG: hypothetical protein OXD46_12570 [Chloroflexi bacterium]|nr:hypothetical protein [Chloroflexota bacterium]